MNANEKLVIAARVIRGETRSADTTMPRIYLNTGRRDVRAFFEFPDADTDTLGGANLIVSIDECGQSPKWYAAQKANLIRRFRCEGLALVALWSGEYRDTAQVFADDIMDADIDALGDEEYEAVFHDLDNCRTEEAREKLADVLPEYDD